MQGSDPESPFILNILTYILKHGIRGGLRDLRGRSSSLEHGPGRLPDQLPGFAAPALWIYQGSTGPPVLFLLYIVIVFIILFNA